MKISDSIWTTPHPPFPPSTPFWCWTRFRTFLSISHTHWSLLIFHPLPPLKLHIYILKAPRRFFQFTSHHVKHTCKCIKPTFSGREEKLCQKWRCINHPEIVCWGKVVLQRWFSGWVIVCFCFSHKPTFGVTGVFINLKICGKLLSTYWNLKSHIKKDKFSSDPSKSLYARKPFQSAMNCNLKGHTEIWSGKCLMCWTNPIKW